jgi:hypothetical protein
MRVNRVSSTLPEPQPNSSTSFGYTVTGGGLPASFNLVDDGSNTNNSKVLTNLVVGQTYTITEIQPADGTYALASITCTGGGTGSTVIANSTATVTLSDSENVVCIFVNTLIQVSPEQAAASAAIAFTGSDTRLLGGVALVSIMFGAFLLLVSRRRRRTSFEA